MHETQAENNTSLEKSDAHIEFDSEHNFGQ